MLSRTFNSNRTFTDTNPGIKKNHNPIKIVAIIKAKATRVQILDENDCISHCTNTLGKGMNPIILPPAMGK